MVKFIRERHYILLQQNQTYQGACTSFHPKGRLLLKHVLWTWENLQHVSWGEQRESCEWIFSFPWFEFFFSEEIKSKTVYVCWCHLETPILFFVFIWRELSDSTCFSPKVNSKLISFSLDLILPHVRIFYFQNEWHKRFWNRDSLSSCSQSLWRQEQSFWPPTSRTSVKFDWLLANQI